MKRSAALRKLRQRFSSSLFFPILLFLILGTSFSDPPNPPSPGGGLPAPPPWSRLGFPRLVLVVSAAFCSDLLDLGDQLLTNLNPSEIHIFIKCTKLKNKTTQWSQRNQFWKLLDHLLASIFNISQFPENSYFATTIMRNGCFGFSRPAILASKVHPQIIIVQDTFLDTLFFACY